jgi:hypothetical protein
MRPPLSLAALPLAALLLIGADEPNNASADAVEQTGFPTHEPALRNQPANCRDRIEQVRQERGLPKLRRETAKPGEPLHFYAVLREMDGCQVLVMANDQRDIRPLPDRPEGPARLYPAQ